MKLTSLILAGVGAATLLLTTSAQAQTFADWTFQSDTTGTNNTPIADTGLDGQTGNGTAKADAIGMTNSYNSTTSTNTDDVLLGVTGDTGTLTNNNADLTNEWRVRGKSPGNGWSSQAPIASQGAQFFSSTAGTSAGKNAIQVTFDFYVTTQAESNMEFLYTTNGGTSWNNVALTIPTGNTYLANETGSASDTNTVNGAYVSVTGNSGQDWFQGLTATISDPNALNDSGFGIEMVNASTGADVLGASGGAYNNSSGNWRFDNISIAAVPEPSSWLLGLCAGSLLTGFGLFRARKSARRS
jgi:hypothetical protein